MGNLGDVKEVLRAMESDVAEIASKAHMGEARAKAQTVHSYVRKALQTLEG
jgi:hypothetical protein